MLANTESLIFSLPIPDHNTNKVCPTRKVINLKSTFLNNADFQHCSGGVAVLLAVKGSSEAKHLLSNKQVKEHCMQVDGILFAKAD